MTTPPFASLTSFAPAEPERTWSDEQQAIFSWFGRSTLMPIDTLPARIFVPQTQHLVVEAYAGTGKTTTILEAISRAPETSILLAAFNKRIAEELKTRLTHPGAQAMTLHGVGYKQVQRYWERINVEFKDRQYDLARRVCGVKVPDAIIRTVAKLHTKGREIRPLAQCGQDLQPLAIMYDCAPDREWEAVGYTLDVVADFAYRCMEVAAEERPTKGIDFADMLYLPLRNKWVMPSFNLVVVDEAQDMSDAQLMLAQGVLKPGGRMCIVGDPHQAIYSFRGADSHSLSRLQKQLQAGQLTLSTTYRCGKTIVSAAQRYVPDFKAADHNPEGEVRTVSYETLMTEAQPGDFILSRINAPLVGTAYGFLKQGKRARIEGRDIGAQLLTIVKKVSKRAGYNATLPMWLVALREWNTEEVQKADAAGLEGKAQMLLDQWRMLLSLTEGDVATVSEVEARIQFLFDDVADKKRDTIICSSVHKAKGLEAKRVWVLKDTLGLPAVCLCGHRHPYGKELCSKCKCRGYRPNMDAVQEETNIEYVAVTRAIGTLVWVTGLPE